MRAAAARAPDRTAIALLGIDIETLARVRARDRARLRGHQARLGAHQLQLLHLRRRLRLHHRGRASRRDPRWKLLADYHFDPATGLWRHHVGQPEPPLRLSQITYDATGRPSYPRHHARAPESVLPSYLDDARPLFTAIEGEPAWDDQPPPGVTSDFEQLRWFDLPAESMR